MSSDLIRRLIEATTAVIRAEAETLTQLDQAIGDGDHGLNMKRGFEAIAEQKDALAAEPLGKALQKAGTILVMKVGGASGPLYGSLLMAMGKAAREPLDAAVLADMLAAGIAAVEQRGKSKAGEKTLLDVLHPALEALRAGAGKPASALAEAVQRAAEAGREATVPLQATKGRASFLGARSVGHVDPGAESCALLIGVVCKVLEEAEV